MNPIQLFLFQYSWELLVFFTSVVQDIQESRLIDSLERRKEVAGVTA